MLKNGSSSWNNAEAICRAEGGQLAALESLEELQLVQVLCAGKAGGCWVGGHEVAHQLSWKWSWSDCRVAWNTSGPLGTPAAPANSPDIGGGACSLAEEGVLTLVQENCGSEHSFVCSLGEGM